MEIHMAYATFSTLEEARKACLTLVERKFAACANILPAHTSIYEWEGKVLEHQEVAVIFKTPADRVYDLISEIKLHHSYKEPCIVTWKLDGGSPSFLNWVVQQTNR